jgi:death on curing protein
MTEPRWASQRALESLHSVSAAAFGGPAGVRDKGLLESAVAAPRNRFLHDPEADLAALAAAYGFALARNHPFVDGNKRISLLAIGLFLKLNDFTLAVEQVDAFNVIMRLAAGQLPEDELASWIRQHVSKQSRIDSKA